MKSILISQPKPESGDSPYFELEKKWNVKVEFRPFIKVEGISQIEFIKQGIHLENFTAVIFTSRIAVDNFFSMAKTMRWKLSENLKYLCQTENIALYLQKYIVYRKRKVMFSKTMNFSGLMPLIKKYSSESYLLTSSDVLKKDLPIALESENIKYQRCILYKTLSADLSDIGELKSDILVFFSPSGIKSLFENFKGFKQNNTIIAAFGKSTVAEVEKRGLTCNIPAPTPEYPSMYMALNSFLKNNIGEKVKV